MTAIFLLKRDPRFSRLATAAPKGHTEVSPRWTSIADSMAIRVGIRPSSMNLTPHPKRAEMTLYDYVQMA